MKWAKIILIAIIAIFIISLIVVDRKLNIAVTNTSDKEVIQVSLNVENNKPKKINTGYSMFPINFYDFDAKLGFQKILVNCPDLHITKEIKIFTLYRNNVDIEFTKGMDDKYILIDRNSWFRLTYE